MEELIRLEERGWRALSSSDEDARAFYGEILDDDVVMLLPGGMVLRGRDETLSTLGAPWATFALEDARVTRVADDVALVTYGVVARRSDATEYSALMSSLYARRPDGWRLVLHQQTPR